ncbi:class I SAM-dependent methyltransferase [Paenibacillaceae bacterium]|nr:class I SAM-dependent methyltransferase [Paenibacillaceae bacterium]
MDNNNHNINHIGTIKNSWNEWSETWYPKYRTTEVISKIIQNPLTAFHPTAYAMIRKVLPNLQGARICVPSSGDNHAVFAFHLLGAKVTSCDISENQLANSARIAREQGWDIEFVCDDTMQLNKVKSGEFDFVFTSNGVHVWINDLHAMYHTIHRILNNGGSYMMFDIHPFLRPFGIQAAAQIKVVNPYDATGPFGEVPTYKWRIQDLINAMIASGLNVKQLEEMFAEDGTFWVDESKDEEIGMSRQQLDQLCNWRSNPLAALPQWLAVVAVKNCTQGD